MAENDGGTSHGRIPATDVGGSLFRKDGGRGVHHARAGGGHAGNVQQLFLFLFLFFVLVNILVAPRGNALAVVLLVLRTSCVCLLLFFVSTDLERTQKEMRVDGRERGTHTQTQRPCRIGA